MDLLEFLGYELPKPLDENVDLTKTQRYFSDLERAVDSAQKACCGSEEEGIVEEVDSINDEMDWVTSHFYDLVEAYSNQESQIYELESLVDGLTQEVHSRMTEEEIKEFEQAQIIAKLKAKEST